MVGAHKALFDLTAWRDPNLVAISDFFHTEEKMQVMHINFFGYLASDESPLVREAMVHAMGEWLLRLPERMDHEGRLMPFLLCGMVDDAQELQKISLDYLERLGAQVCVWRRACACGWASACVRARMRRGVSVCRARLCRVSAAA
jgi:hypothetical protein